MVPRPGGPAPARIGPRPFTAALALGLVAVALWRTGLAVRTLPAELAALTPAALARALATPLEKRIQATIPRQARDFVALARSTPEEASIQIPRDPEQEGATWPSLRSLFFPRRFSVFDPAQGWDGAPGTYLLAPADAGFAAGRAHARLIERRGAFELWHADGAEPR